ncbi:MAG: hypothetical protein ACYC9O_14160 [Candidatus Latescibacterota bacterium]
METPDNPKSGSDRNQDVTVRRKTMQKTPKPLRLQWIILLCGVVTVIGMKIGMHTASQGNASRIVEIPSDIEQTYYDIAIRLMEDRKQVRGAAITRSNRIFNLVLIVDPSISPDYALELGDEFVRTVKGYLDSFPNREKELGISRYTYLVGIFDPEKKVVAEGTKYPLSRRVRWQQ